MRVTSPAVTIKDIWDALVADYGIAGTYGLLLETNLDGKVSEAKADVSALALEASITSLASDVATLETLVDDLETRLSAARAGYLDQLDFNLQEKLTEIDGEVEGLGGAAMRGTDGVDTAAMRGTDGAALASAWTAARAESLTNLGRSLEDYTPTIGHVNSNNTTEVTVLNIASGRGILMGLGGYASQTIMVTLTVDGVALATNKYISNANTNANMLTMIPFTSSLLIVMRLAGAGSGKFWAVAQVE